jgi:hypothetical protein
MRDILFIKLLSTYIDENFFKKGHGSNLPQAHAHLFLAEMKKKGLELITFEQLVRLIQNHSKWESVCLNRNQRGTKERAEKFIEEVGIL